MVGMRGAEAVEETDGRRARAERSRTAVVDAILELLHENDRRPTVDEIAERSGVSVRSVFRHFDDTESLLAAAVESHARQNAGLWDLPPIEGSLDERVQHLVACRSDLYEAISPVRRAAEQLRRRSSAISGNLATVRKAFRRQLRDLFAPELDQMDQERCEAVLDGVETATSWAAWEQLRREQDRSRTRSERAVAESVRSLLGRPR
jgi:TetR/AcrR family transcriptional regulator, regulator of autoinduction and epiphytic fitness